MLSKGVWFSRCMSISSVSLLLWVVLGVGCCSLEEVEGKGPFIRAASFHLTLSFSERRCQ